MRDPFTIIDTARITEKGALLTEMNNEYVFKVNRRATKLEIRYAVEQIFGKKVVSVNTMNVSGKKKRERSRNFGRTAHWKKAIVRLKAGETIDLV